MKPNRKILVLGCGESGAAAARLLRAEGADVRVLDSGDSPALRQRAELLAREGARVELNSGPDIPDESFQMAVVSPGVPLSSRWIQTLQSRGIPMVSELEAGWLRRPPCRVAAITGSNGKSTAVKWLAEALSAGGLRAVPAGNYGTPVSEVVLRERSLDWLVLEVSSFQLETVDAFRADIGILLNVHPNHLDRHPDFSAYLRTKARLFSRTEPGDVCLVHEAVAAAAREMAGGQGRWLTFGVEPSSDFRLVMGRVQSGADALADVKGTWFDNDVLGQTAAAVVGALTACGLPPTLAEVSARAFQPLPHRMQLVAESNGVRFVDDSKATNLAAMAAALRMTKGSVRLIAGGLLKESNLASVKGLLKDRVKAVYLIGTAARAMAANWSDVVRCVPCETLDCAVDRAAADAVAGDTVLLAPACTSFDQFQSYKERGERFAQAVQHFLERENKKAHISKSNE